MKDAAIVYIVLRILLERNFLMTLSKDEPLALPVITLHPAW